ncbi:Inorganic pyrophosphatase [Planctomycetes bacterium Poly30]|uniref:inorganic diphosphatase n=1 Tax=Saltatorellus ferox TaxID=2528018 RepID=A0A518ESL6_9BACT|nr:Inorganic pyrophosphatase [Planctomycetes bacterium Poly30]
MTVRRQLQAYALLTFAVACGGIQPETRGVGAGVLPGATDYVRDFPARRADGAVNVVVEIPAGTDAKWEITKPDGQLAWEIEDGQPRVVRYLGYPGNYGMVPGTLLPKELGGDGDPLDVLVLGPAVERGTVIGVRVIGVLELLDGGERDDKLVAVLPGTPLGHLESLGQLDSEFPGVTSIVRTWFENYKGRGEDGQPRLVARGYADRARAEEILWASMEAFGARH